MHTHMHATKGGPRTPKSLMPGFPPVESFKLSTGRNMATRFGQLQCTVIPKSPHSFLKNTCDSWPSTAVYGLLFAQLPPCPPCLSHCQSADSTLPPTLGSNPKLGAGSALRGLSSSQTVSQTRRWERAQRAFFVPNCLPNSALRPLRGFSTSIPNCHTHGSRNHTVCLHHVAISNLRVFPGRSCFPALPASATLPQPRASLRC